MFTSTLSLVHTGGITTQEKGHNDVKERSVFFFMSLCSCCYVLINYVVMFVFQTGDVKDRYTLCFAFA